MGHIGSDQQQTVEEAREVVQLAVDELWRIAGTKTGTFESRALAAGKAALRFGSALDDYERSVRAEALREREAERTADAALSRVRGEALTDAVQALLDRALGAEAEVERLREALRRYMIYAEAFGYERLSEEFGPAEFPDSSWSMEAWIDRVLREPARAALGERLWGLPMASEDVEPSQIQYSRDAIIRGADDE